MGKKTVNSCWHIHPDKHLTTSSERLGLGPRSWCQLIQNSSSVSASVWKCWELLFTIWKPLLISTKFVNTLLYCSNISKAHFLKIRVWGKNCPKNSHSFVLVFWKTSQKCVQALWGKLLFWGHIFLEMLSCFFICLVCFCPWFWKPCFLCYFSHPILCKHTGIFLLHFFTKARHSVFVGD